MKPFSAKSLAYSPAVCYLTPPNGWLTTIPARLRLFPESAGGLKRLPEILIPLLLNSTVRLIFAGRCVEGLIEAESRVVCSTWKGHNAESAAHALAPPSRIYAGILPKMTL